MQKFKEIMNNKWLYRVLRIALCFIFVILLAFSFGNEKVKASNYTGCSIYWGNTSYGKFALKIDFTVSSTSLTGYNSVAVFLTTDERAKNITENDHNVLVTSDYTYSDLPQTSNGIQMMYAAKYTWSCTNNKVSVYWDSFRGKTAYSTYINTSDLPSGNYYVILESEYTGTYAFYIGKVSIKTLHTKIGSNTTTKKLYFVDDLPMTMDALGNQDNYLFKGYYTSDSYTTQCYTTSGSFVVSSKSAWMATNDIYAYYVRYNLKYDYNGTTKTVQIPWGTSYPNIPGGFYCPSGYHITSVTGTVYTAAGSIDGTYNLYDASGNSISSYTNYAPNDVTLTVNTAKDTYTLKYDGNGGTGTGHQYTKNCIDNLNLDANHFTRDYYDFLGWSTDKNATTATYQASQATSSLSATHGDTVTLYAIWKAKSYQLTINNYYGTTNLVKTVAYGEAVNVSSPTREGYSIKEMSDSIPQTMPGHDVTINVTWQINTYTITLLLYENGETYKTFQYQYQADVLIEEIPTRIGYKFLYWNYPFPQTMPASDLTFYAIYKPLQYKITYMVEGEIFKTVSLNYDSTIDEVKPDQIVGKKFTGWSPAVPEKMPNNDLTVTAQFVDVAYRLTYVIDENNSITEDYAMLESVQVIADPKKDHYDFMGWDKTIPATLTEDLVVNAIWQIHTHTITFKNVINGDGVITKTYEYGATIEIPNCIWANYDLTGWDKVIPETMPDNDLEFTALWEKHTYYIYFETSTTPEYSPIGVKWKEVIPSIPSPIRSGYRFLGWDQIIPAVMPDHDITLKAQWDLSKYKIYYYVNGSIYQTREYAYGETIQQVDDPTMDGYHFLGWDTTIPKTMGNNDISTTARFDIVIYTIQFETNCDMTIESQQVTYGYKVKRVTDPSIENYNFMGWFIDPEFKTEFNFDEPPTSDLTLYACFKEYNKVNTIRSNNGEYEVQIIQKDGFYYNVKVNVDVTLNKDLEEAMKSGKLVHDYSKYLQDSTVIGCVYKLEVVQGEKALSVHDATIILDIPDGLESKKLYVYSINEDDTIQEITNYQKKGYKLTLDVSSVNEICLLYEMNAPDEKEPVNVWLIVGLGAGGLAVVSTIAFLVKRIGKKRKSLDKFKF